MKCINALLMLFAALLQVKFANFFSDNGIKNPCMSYAGAKQNPMKTIRC